MCKIRWKQCFDVVENIADMFLVVIYKDVLFNFEMLFRDSGINIIVWTLMPLLLWYPFTELFRT